MLHKVQHQVPHGPAVAHGHAPAPKSARARELKPSSHPSGARSAKGGAFGAMLSAAVKSGGAAPAAPPRAASASASLLPAPAAPGAPAPPSAVAALLGRIADRAGTALPENAATIFGANAGTPDPPASTQTGLPTSAVISASMRADGTLSFVQAPAASQPWDQSIARAGYTSRADLDQAGEIGQRFYSAISGLAATDEQGHAIDPIVDFSAGSVVQQYLDATDAAARRDPTAGGGFPFTAANVQWLAGKGDPIAQAMLAGDYNGAQATADRAGFVFTDAAGAVRAFGAAGAAGAAGASAT